MREEKKKLSCCLSLHPVSPRQNEQEVEEERVSQIFFRRITFSSHHTHTPVFNLAKKMKATSTVAFFTLSPRHV